MKHGLWTGLLAAALILGGCGDQGSGGKTSGGPGGGAKTVEVGLVFDVGGRGDKSFNDAAYRGLKKAEKELGVGVDFFEPSKQTSHGQAVRRLAQKGTPLILGIGVMFSKDIRELAKEFPKLHFLCIDYDPAGEPIPPNLRGVKFKEHEGSFLVGAIAALVSKTGKIGFVGGMEIPLIRKFEAGYKAGAKAVRADVVVLSAYAGQTPEAFKNPNKGKELGLSQYQRGADVIYHASGSTGLGVFGAARETNNLAIGVDSDQAASAEPAIAKHILTSMIKQVDAAVFQAIKDHKDGKWTGGMQAMGLAEDGVGYVYNDANKQWITDAIRAQVEALRAKIVQGELTVAEK